MFKMKSTDRYAHLPDPIALSAEQLKEVATQTAGGASLSLSVLTGIICGGRPALDAMTAPNINPAANMAQQMRQFG